MLLEMLGVGWLIFGLFFCAIGVIGVLRMPDVYTRLHASGKVATLGLFGLLVGAVFLMPTLFFLKILALGLFILVTSPVATHAIAASEYRRKEIVEELVDMKDAEEDIDLKSVDVSEFLYLSNINDIIEAQQRINDEEIKEDDS